MTNFRTVNPAYNLGTGAPVYSHPMQQQAATQMPAYSQNLTSPIYNYPTSSLYGQQPKQQLSGVNIYIYNPTGIGGGAPAVFTDQMMPPAAQTPIGGVTNNIQNNLQQPSAQLQQPSQMFNTTNNINEQSPVASTPVNNENKTESAKQGKTKEITQLTDNYVRSLENYLKNPDSNIRQTGIKDLIKRFEEDSSRYENPSLTALLNIALQDPDANNRFMAMSPIAGGSAHGDENTMALLQNLQSSDKLFGQEAQLASEALLKAAQEKITVPDNSPEKPQHTEKE